MVKIIRNQGWRGEFDVAVSLGGDCQTAYQLHRLGYRGPAYPFDWLITPFDSLYKLLEKKFDKFLEKEDLALIVNKHVQDNRYGTKLLHDFKKDGKNFLADYQLHYDKYQRRIKRFLELFGSKKRILLVRRELKREQAMQLMNMLKNVYGRDFKLLVLGKNKWDLPGVWMEQIAQRVPYNWHGVNEEWDRVMKQYKITKVTEIKFYNRR